MKIVILDGYTENPGDLSWEGFERLGTLTVYDRTEPSEIVSRIGDAEAVIINKCPITAETMDACAERLADMVADIAEGAPSKSEALGHREFHIIYKYQDKAGCRMEEE